MSFAKIIYNLFPFKKEIFCLLKKFYIPKFYQKLVFKGDFRVKANGVNFKMYHYGYLIENEIFWKGLGKSWEPESIKLWGKLCRESEVIFDIGANTGIYSLISQAINPESIVYAFEPVSRTFEKLKTNVLINNYNIKCVEKAISNYDGTGVIYDSLKGNIYSVTVNRNLYPDYKLYPVEISTIKLDSFIIENNIQKIDLLKIDVETHEAEVLEGFKQFLKEYQPTLLIEILFDDMAVRIENLIKDSNYLYFNINEQKGPRLVDKLTKSDNFNYLICKRKVAQKLNLV